MDRLGIWIFCFSELFLFGGLLVARFVLWGGTRPELNQTLGLITTSVLLVSSFFMARGETAIAHNDRKTFQSSMVWTFVLGLIFLLGVVMLEWGGGEVHPTDGAFGAVFYGMTGIHAFHVLTGLILIAINWNRGRKGEFDAEDHWAIEATAIYWHFIDVVWVFFYPAIYLIGLPIHG
jgi:cytochrome c oxidase subunit 3